MGQPAQVAEAGRRVDFEPIAWSEDQPLDAVGVIGGDQLAQRSAGVVADQRHCFELEQADELGNQARQPVGRKVGPFGHRHRVRPQRPVGHDAPVGRREQIGGVVPEPAVGQKSVHEDQRLALAKVAVLHWAEAGVQGARNGGVEVVGGHAPKMPAVLRALNSL